MKGINNSISVQKVIGCRIKMCRENRKLTRRKLSEYLIASDKAPQERAPADIDKLENRLKQWEYGNNPISIEWVPAICEILGCDAGYLFGEYEEKTHTNCDICKSTGLTESAIDTLRKCDENVVKFISYLLESGSVIPTGLKVSQCIDTKLRIKHYQTDVLPKLSIPVELEKKAISEWDFSDKYLDIEEKRTKVMEELNRLDTEYTALLWRCNQGIGVAIDTFIDKEVEKYG